MVSTAMNNYQHTFIQHTTTKKAKHISKYIQILPCKVDYVFNFRLTHDSYLTCIFAGIGAKASAKDVCGCSWLHLSASPTSPLDPAISKKSKGSGKTHITKVEKLHESVSQGYISTPKMRWTKSNPFGPFCKGFSPSPGQHELEPGVRVCLNSK